MQQETIALSFGQRIGPFLLNRVLRRQDHEELRQFVRLASHRNLSLLHGLEHSRLHLGRGAVDFISEDEVAEDRARLELKAPLARLRRNRLQCR